MLTVQTPATDRTLVTVDELRAALGLAADSYETELTALNTQIADSLAAACKMATGGAVPPSLRSEVLVETQRLMCGASELLLARRPITAVASIVESGVTLTTNEYETDGASGLIYRLCSDERIYWMPGKIVVTYTAGWSTVPAPLKLAATKFARILWTEEGPGARDPGLKRERIDGVIEREWWVAPASDPLLSAEIVELLGPYRNFGA